MENSGFYTAHLLNYLPVVRQPSLTGCPPVTALAGGTPWFKRIVRS